VPGLQLESGELGHEVEFGGPDVAVRAAGQPGFPVLIEPEVVRDDVLAQDVVGVQADVAGAGLPDNGLLAWRELAQLGHPQLDHEPASRREVAGRITETGDLPGLGEQAGDRVVDEVEGCTRLGPSRKREDAFDLRGDGVRVGAAAPVAARLTVVLLATGSRLLASRGPMSWAVGQTKPGRILAMVGSPAAGRGPIGARAWGQVPVVQSA
jgi:hypothetical protein